MPVDTVFSHTISAETILFLIWKSKGYSTNGQRSQYINGQKLFKGGNYISFSNPGGSVVINCLDVFEFI